MKLGVTATRNGLSTYQVQNVRQFFIDHYDITEIHHGDCVRGDETIHNIATDLYGVLVRIVIHPPIDGRLRAYCEGDMILAAKEYLTRNRDIVLATDMLLAAPNTQTEVVRSGTWATIRYARKLKQPIVIFLPDGSVRYN